LINGRISFRYKEVTTTLVNLELKRKDGEYFTSDASAEVLIVRGSSPKKKSIKIQLEAHGW